MAGTDAAGAAHPGAQPRRVQLPRPGAGRGLHRRHALRRRSGRHRPLVQRLRHHRRVDPDPAADPAGRRRWCTPATATTPRSARRRRTCRSGWPAATEPTVEGRRGGPPPGPGGWTFRDRPVTADSSRTALRPGSHPAGTVSAGIGTGEISAWIALSRSTCAAWSTCSAITSTPARGSTCASCCRTPWTRSPPAAPTEPDAPALVRIEPPEVDRRRHAAGARHRHRADRGAGARAARHHRPQLQAGRTRLRPARVPRPVRHRPALLLPGRRRDPGAHPARRRRPTVRWTGLRRRPLRGRACRPRGRAPSRAPPSRWCPRRGAEQWLTGPTVTELARLYGVAAAGHRPGRRRRSTTTGEPPWLTAPGDAADRRGADRATPARRSASTRST